MYLTVRRRPMGRLGPAYFAYFGRRLVKCAALLPGMRVLDVACGRGAVLFAAAEAVGLSGSVIGIDLAPGMVDATRAEILQRELPQATVQVMDAEHLQFPDATFDVLTCGFALFFLPRSRYRADGVPAGAASRRPPGRQHLGISR